MKDHISDMARFDLVIYGASGYTGECVINFVVRAEKEHGISWAVAGRNENRLREALDRLTTFLILTMSRFANVSGPARAVVKT